MLEENIRANFTGCKIYGKHIEHYFEAKENNIVPDEQHKEIYVLKHHPHRELLDIISIIHRLVVKEFSFAPTMNGSYTVCTELYINGKSQLKIEFITTKGNELFITGILGCVTAVLINLTNQTGFRVEFITHHFNDFRTYYNNSVSYERKQYGDYGEEGFTAIGIRIDMPEHLKTFQNEEMLIHIECNHHELTHGITSLYYEIVNGYIIENKDITCVVNKGKENQTLVYLFDGSIEYNYVFPIGVNILNIDEVSNILYNDPWPLIQEICYDNE